MHTTTTCFRLAGLDHFRHAMEEAALAATFAFPCGVDTAEDEEPAIPDALPITVGVLAEPWPTYALPGFPTPLAGLPLR